MIAHAIAFDSLDQLRYLTLGRFARQSSDFRGCSPPFQQCQQHLEPRDTEHVRKHAANRKLHVPEDLLNGRKGVQVWPCLCQDRGCRKLAYSGNGL